MKLKLCFLLILAFIFIGCDNGRKIDYKERAKQLGQGELGKGNPDNPAFNFYLLRHDSNSRYSFYALNLLDQAGFTLDFESLLRMTTPTSAPSVTLNHNAHKVFRCAKPDASKCSLWFLKFDSDDILFGIRGSYELNMIRLPKVILYSVDTETPVKLAEYEYFRINFLANEYQSFTAVVARQVFSLPADYVFDSFPDSGLHNSSFLFLKYAAQYIPLPTFEARKILSAVTQETAQSMDFTTSYVNSLTQENFAKKFRLEIVNE